ncbi:MAG TPA: thiamine phosphate synthase [Patescibacteria group bacterium]|nr:thiamine phosphate synthase [Patescibacteria group bacterium]
MAVVSRADAGIRAAAGTDPAPTILQLRAPDLAARALEGEARRLVQTTTLPVLVSSRCDIALAVGAAGVNLPERDIAVRDARKLLGERLVGRSVHSIESALSAEADGADFVIFGPVWPSATHPAGTAAGLGELTALCRALRIPVIAIGGVTVDRIAECHAAGAAGYAAIGMFR